MRRISIGKNFLTLGFVILLLASNLGYAKTYYVDQNNTSASDKNPGTADSPWLTISHAARKMTAGDTVQIRKGIYSESVTTVRKGNQQSGYIVFEGYPGERPVIDGKDVETSENGFIIGHSYIKLNGLVIRNWRGNGIWIEKAAHIEISDCEIHDVTYGIGVADGTHDFELNRVEVHHFDLYGFDASPSGGKSCYNGFFNDCIAHTGRDPSQNVDGFALGHGNQHGFVFNRCEAYGVSDGFDISARDTKLNRCAAHDCLNSGYKLWEDKIVLLNCLGYHNESSNVELDWDQQPGTVALWNCTFFDSGSYTIWVENGGDSLHMNNCILAGGNNSGLTFEQRDTNKYRGDYNIFHNDNPDRSINVGYEDEFSLEQIAAGVWRRYSGQDMHSLVVTSKTKLFVSPKNFDLHLTPTSLAIDGGISEGAPLVDFDGKRRDSSPDIGAFEYERGK
jgi:hypothetical protein